MSEQKVKSVAIRFTLKGQGFVNFGNGKEDRYFLNTHCGCNFGLNNNVKIAKYNVYKLPEDKWITRTSSNGNTNIQDCVAVPKISKDCLRHAMYADNEEYLNVNNGKCSNTMKGFYFSSESALERGYLLADNKTNRKKTVVTVTDAELSNNAHPLSEFHSNSAPKDDDSATSLFKEDSIGKTEWTGIAIIDLKQCRVMIADDFGGRRAVLDSIIEDGSLENAFLARYNRIPYQIKYIQPKKASWQNSSCEKALVFDDEFVLYLVRDIIKRIKGISIRTNGGFVECTDVAYKFLCNINDNVYDDGYISLDSNNISELTFEPEDFYREVDDSTVMAIDEYRKQLIKSEEENKKKNEATAKKGKKTDTPDAEA